LVFKDDWEFHEKTSSHSYKNIFTRYQKVEKNINSFVTVMLVNFYQHWKSASMKKVVT